MKWQNWQTSIVAALLALSAAGCMTTPKLPPHNPERLSSVSEISIAVQVEVRRDSGKDSAVAPDWSVAARDQMIASLAKSLSSEGMKVAVSDLRPQVPWHVEGHGVKPDFHIPACESVDALAAAGTRLELVAIQTVKTLPTRIFLGVLGVFSPIDPAFWIAAPLAPNELAGGFFGSGVTAVRLCLFRAGASEPAWAYSEWFYGGLDLRNPANAQGLVNRALDSYRAALAKPWKAGDAR